MAHPLLMLGTGNRKKAKELAHLFADVGIELKTLADVDDPIDVVEDGESFAENAAKKAVQQALHLKQWVLAEDSGLQVDALKGRPGIYSARYSGENATDESNNALLLEELGDLPRAKRGGGYVCHMTLADPSGVIRAESTGTCRGRIVTNPRGEGGFGYDPLFEVLEYHKTFGELPPAVKACISHRARAAKRLVPQLMQLVDSGEWT